MKRLGGFELALLAGLGGGVVYACAAPEDVNPAVLAEAENRYFASTATNPPAPPPSTSTPPTGTTPPVAPTTSTPPPVTTTPPVTPTTAPFAPELGGAPQADEIEPADAIPLDQWLNQ
jgi:hypothetical protein